MRSFPPAACAFALFESFTTEFGILRVPARLSATSSMDADSCSMALACPLLPETGHAGIGYKAGAGSDLLGDGGNADHDRVQGLDNSVHIGFDIAKSPAYS
jgi:hypothetical protein